MSGDKPKKTTQPLVNVWIIGSVIAATLLLVVSILVMSGVTGRVAPLIGSLLSSSTDYSKSAEELEAASKSSAVGETLQYGPLDVRAVAVEQNYTLSESEKAFTAPDENAHYTRVTLSVKRNEARKADFNALAYPVGWGGDIGKAKLNGASSVFLYVDKTLQPLTYGFDHKLVLAVEDSTSTEVIYVYKLPASAPHGELEIPIEIFSKVSPVVGTEGMPKKQYIYKLQLWSE